MFSDKNIFNFYFIICYFNIDFDTYCNQREKKEYEQNTNK